MRHAALLLVLVAFGVALGCGSGDRQVDELRTDHDRAIGDLQKQLNELNAAMRQSQARLEAISSDMLNLDSALETLSDAERRARVADATTAGDKNAAGKAVAASAADIEPAEGDIATLSAELARMRERYDADKKAEKMRDPSRTWEAMGNSAELLQRLDALAEEHAKTIADDQERLAFMDDVAALKADIEERSKMTFEEKVQHQKDRMQESMQYIADEEHRELVNQQLERLDRGTDTERRVMVDAYDRTENAASLMQFGLEHNIPQDTMSDHGLHGFGGGRQVIFQKAEPAE